MRQVNSEGEDVKGRGRVAEESKRTDRFVGGAVDEGTFEVLKEEG